MMTFRGDTSVYKRYVAVRILFLRGDDCRLHAERIPIRFIVRLAPGCEAQRYERILTLDSDERALLCALLDHFAEGNRCKAQPDSNMGMTLTGPCFLLPIFREYLVELAEIVPKVIVEHRVRELF